MKRSFCPRLAALGLLALPISAGAPGEASGNTAAARNILQLGSITSASNVIVNGKENEVKGIPSIPVNSGDEVGITETVAQARLVDENRVELDKLSKAKVRFIKNRHIYIYLRAGGVRFLPVVGKLFICAGERLFTPVPDAEGFVVIDEKEKKVLAHDSKGSVDIQGKQGCDENGPGAFLWTKPRMGMIVGGAAAAGGGTAFRILRNDGSADVQKPVSVSPNR